MSREVRELIDDSPHRDDAYRAAGGIIVGGPEELERLRRDLDRIAYVVDDLDRSVIKKELPSQLIDTLDEDLRRAFREAALALSEEASREFEGQDSFATVQEFVAAMPANVRRMHVVESRLRRASDDLRHRRAVLLSEIVSGTVDPELHARAGKLNVLLHKANAKLQRWVFEVRGGVTSHMVRVRAAKVAELGGVAGDDVFLSCDCGAWRWDGPEHHAQSKGYLDGKPRGTASVPIVRDPDGKHWACKHVLAVARIVSQSPLPLHLRDK